MFLLLAFFALFGPVIAGLSSVATAVLLRKAAPALATVILLLISALITILLFEFQYDLGLELPDWSWMPTGASSEAATLTAACVLLGLHLLTWIRWPAGLRGKWVTITATVFWALTTIAFVVLSQLSYSI